jgi:hypothetical protein
MKKYIAIALLMVLGTVYPSYARWSVGTAGGGAAAAGGGGETTWIYSGDGTYESSGSVGGSSNAMCGKWTQSGNQNITKLSYWFHNLGTATSCKIALWTATAGGSIIASVVDGGTIASPVAGAYNDVTVASTGLTDGTIYALCGVCNSTDWQWAWDTSSNGMYCKGPYASYPASCTDNYDAITSQNSRARVGY